MTPFEIFVGIAGLVIGFWAIQLYVPDAKPRDRDGAAAPNDEADTDADAAGTERHDPP